MARRRLGRIYGATGHPGLEAVPLATAFVIGTAGVVAFKILPVHPAFGALFAALVLVLYALIAYVATPLRMDSETIGDNCYYLGFLLTLTSLAITLYFVVAAPAGDRAALIPEIISGFGVALSSTIVGVFLRVLMLQLKVDIEARERRARLELNEVARAFRLELGSTLDRVKSFSTESVQQAAEREVRMRAAFDALMADMQAELLKSAQEFGPALREAVRLQTRSALEQVSNAVAEAGATASVGIRGSMGAMVKRATNLTEAQVEAAAQIAEAVGQLQAVAASLAEASEMTVSRLSATQNALADFTQEITRRIEGEGSTMQAALETTRLRIEEGADTYLAATARVAERLDAGHRAIEDSMAGGATRITLSCEGLGASIEAASSRLDEAGRATASAPLGGASEKNPEPRTERSAARRHDAGT